MVLGFGGGGCGTEHQLVSLVQQAGWRASPKGGQQGRCQEGWLLQALSDVVPQRVLYLRRLAHAYYDQLAILQAHEDVALLLGDWDTAYGYTHGHGLHAQRQAAQRQELSTGKEPKTVTWLTVKIFSTQIGGCDCDCKNTTLVKAMKYCENYKQLYITWH